MDAVVPWFASAFPVAGRDDGAGMCCEPLLVHFGLDGFHAIRIGVIAEALAVGFPTLVGEALIAQDGPVFEGLMPDVARIELVNDGLDMIRHLIGHLFLDEVCSVRKQASRSHISSSVRPFVFKVLMAVFLYRRGYDPIDCASSVGATVLVQPIEQQIHQVTISPHSTRAMSPTMSERPPSGH